MKHDAVMKPVERNETDTQSLFHSIKNLNDLIYFS